MSTGITKYEIGGLNPSEAHGLIAQLLFRINEEIKLSWGFTNELEDLQRHLTGVSYLLEAASVRPNTDLLMFNWLVMVKDVAYYADDLLDDWSYEVLKRRAKLGALPSLHLKVDPKKELMKLISRIFSDAKDLGLKPIGVAAGDVYKGFHKSILETHERRLLDQECFSGRQKETTFLVDLLCEASSRDAYLTVIGVYGMGGVGKTALCEQVSKAVKVIQKYDCQVIRVAVSNYDLIDILSRMVEMLFEYAYHTTDRRAIVQKLQEKLKGKKYLLILDDVRDTFDWKSLEKTLHGIGGSKGTSLLVISRDKSVLKKMGTYCDGDGNIINQWPFIYELKGLSEDDSWALFMKRICVDYLASREKELMARWMIEKCNGVPLAIRLLGDLLRDKSIGMWKEIAESELWMIEVEYGILPALMLSFNYLPNMALKKCFSYCAVFEEDEVIKKNQLIYMWMAQGFLHPYDKMELVGEEYFEHLLNCSLLQHGSMDKRENESFRMHDLVRELALFVSREDNTIAKVNSIYHEKLQTCFLPFNADLGIVKNCRRLRVLRIDRGNLLKLGHQLGRFLKHLRFLDVFIDHILANISDLYHLQTLCIRTSPLTSPFRRDQLLKIFIKKNIGHLVNLRHICSNLVIGVPKGLRHLTSLLTLPAIDLNYDWGGSFSEIGPLVNLRGTLEIRNLNCIKYKEEARSLFLGNKPNIHELVLEWSSGYKLWASENKNEILEALQPHANLAMLRVENYIGTRFPRWLIERDSPLNNLVSLTIRDCPYAEGILNLENFKSLRFLDVRNSPSCLLHPPDLKYYDLLQPGLPMMSMSMGWKVIALILRARGKMRAMLKSRENMKLFCCLFPCDFDFDSDTLVQLWMALGFSRQRCVEDFCQRFFSILLEEKFILFSRTNVLTGIPLYNVDHNKASTLLDGIQRTTNEDLFNVIQSKTTNGSKSLHISLVSDYIHQTTFEKLKSYGFDLRTLIFIRNYGSSLKELPSDMFSTLESVQALDLSGSHISELPRSIGNARQLRYLDLSFTLIESLPHSIDRLRHLQTLKLHGCKHLYELPKGMKELICLRHLYFDVLGQLSFLPKGIGALIELRTLSAFIVDSEEGCSIRELKTLNNLCGSICISGLENVSHVDVHEAALQDKKHLRQLHLRWSDRELFSDEDKCDACSIISTLNLSKNLEELQIICYPGFILPNWVNLRVHDRLVSITLLNCENNSLSISLGQLPNLKYLNIIHMNRVAKLGGWFRGGYYEAYGAFPRLEKLVIDGMFSLETWIDVCDCDFELLCTLVIKQCPKLTALPFLPYLSSLKHVEISHCTLLEGLPEGKLPTSLETLIIDESPFLKNRCSKDGDDWHKIKHVSNVWIDLEAICSTENVHEEAIMTREDICSVLEDDTED